jgi:hypothetical protein
MGLKGAAELAEEAAQEHRKMFEELATFNYGIIGIMKKQRLEDSADEQQKRRGEMGQPLSQSQKSISSEELNGENSDETGKLTKSINLKNKEYFYNIFLFSSKIQKKVIVV